MDFFRLFLKSPLYYRREKINPFAADTRAPWVLEDLLFCFDLDPRQARRIDPEPEQYLGPLDASGRKLSEAGQVPCPGIKTPAAEETPLKLVPGPYYGVQFRGFELSGFFSGIIRNPPEQEYFTRADFVETALELQKEGLWERQKLEDRIYLRRLFEDGAPVIQILRPLRL